MSQTFRWKSWRRYIQYEMRTEIRYSEDVMLEYHTITNLVILEEVFIGMFISTLLKNDSKGKIYENWNE